MKLAFAVLIGLAAAGCLDTEQEYTLNPDGSGKVRIVAVGSPLRIDFGNDKKPPEQAMKEAARETLEKSQGVDAWTGVEAKLRDDGKVAFSGTAYFKDLKSLKLNIMGMQSSGPELGFQEDGQGGFVLEFKDEQKAKRGGAAPEPSKLTDEQIKAKIREERAKYQQGKAFMETFLKDLRMKTKINVPGAIGAASIFKAAGPSAVEISLEGKAMVKAIDEMMMDDTFMRRQLESGKDMNEGNPFEDDAFLEKMFGTKGPPRVAVKAPLKALFDYEAEAGPARAGMEALRAPFGAGEGGKKPLAAAAPSKGGPLKSVKVGGARLVHFQDRERGISPLNSTSEGLTLALVAELPGAVLGVKEGMLTRAVTDNGEDLLPEREFDRSIHFPRLSEDKAAVVFDAQMKAPSAKARGIKEVSGTLTYTVGGKIKALDLGLTDFKAGTKGKALGAAIEKIAKDEFDGKSEQMELKIELPPDALEAVEFLDAQGKPLDVQRSGYMSGGDSTVFTFSILGKFPAKGRIVAKMFENLAQFEVEFKIQNVDLLGRPLK